MTWSYSMPGRIEKYLENFGWEIEKKNEFMLPGCDGNTEWGVSLWIGLIGLRIGINGEMLSI